MIGQGLRVKSQQILDITFKVGKAAGLENNPSHAYHKEGEKPFDRLGNSGIPLFIGYIALYHYTQAVGNSPEPVNQRRTMPYAGDQKDDK